MAILSIGLCDVGKTPLIREDFLRPYHIDGLLVGKVSFRDDDRTKWRSFREGVGAEVLKLQEFLFHAGFMPRCIFDGVFGYVTQAAVRLFQEYVRTMEGVPDMVPDGIVGNFTMSHIQRWKEGNKISEWGNFSSNHPSEGYKEWMTLLEQSKAYYNANPGPVLTFLNSLPNTYSTKKPSEWEFDKDQIHLVGIRRNQTQSTTKRANDDLFVLLINGMVFTFWGSTDASVAMARRSDEPFLIEGQHLYRFGWHKISEENKIYRALKPLNPKGVMVVRDWDGDNAYTDNDLKVKDSNGKVKGMSVNPSINIHWSGIGTTNFSAGCQVIAGKSYLNHNNSLQDCSQFASSSYSGLNESDKKTKGAYNVLTDLILCYAPQGITHIHYTLGREESLKLSATFGGEYASNTLRKLQSI